MAEIVVTSTKARVSLDSQCIGSTDVTLEHGGIMLSPTVNQPTRTSFGIKAKRAYNRVSNSVGHGLSGSVPGQVFGIPLLKFSVSSLCSASSSEMPAPQP